MLWGGSVEDPEKQEPDTVALRNLNKKMSVGRMPEMFLLTDSF